MVRDRWDEEDELDRDRLRSREPEREPTLGEVIDGAVRKVVTGVIIAGGLIALGIWSSGGSDSSGSDLEYQIVTSADGAMVYRINTDSGSIVACRTASNACWLMQRGSSHLDDEPAQNATLPQPVQAAPPQQQAPAQVAPAQPAPQLPVPQNVTVPAAR